MGLRTCRLLFSFSRCHILYLPEGLASGLWAEIIWVFRMCVRWVCQCRDPRIILVGALEAFRGMLPLDQSCLRQQSFSFIWRGDWTGGSKAGQKWQLLPPRWAQGARTRCKVINIYKWALGIEFEGSLKGRKAKDQKRMFVQERTG